MSTWDGYHKRHRARFVRDRECRSGHAAAVRVPKAVWGLVKEVARHVIRRPVVGVAAAARTPDGRWLLVRRADTGEWALPGGTIEWGETMRAGLERELREEAGVRTLKLGQVVGVYTRPDRDMRFHAVTIVVAATVSEPEQAPMNPLEIRDAQLFDRNELPTQLAHGMTDMLENAINSYHYWE